MNSIIMNLCTNTLDTLLIAYFLTRVLNEKYCRKRRPIIILAALIIFNTFINFKFDIVSMFGFIIIFIVSVIIYSYLLNVNFTRTLIYCILGTIIMFTMEIIAGNLILTIFNIQPSKMIEFSIYRIGGIVFAKGLFYLIIKYGIVRFKIPKYGKLRDSMHIIFIGIFNMTIIFMTFTLYKYMGEECSLGYAFVNIMSIGSIIFSCVIYKVTRKMIYQSQQENVWKMREKEFHKKDFYVQSISDILDTIKSQKHDLNNYLSTLYGLIFLEKYEEAKIYITEINSRVSNMNDIIETSHPVITVLVSMKKNKAIEENIEIDVDIDLPETLQFDFVDLSIVIGNLLDNAIEACQLVKEDIKKKIELSIYIKEKHLIIEVINTKDESIEVDTKNILNRFTTKNDDDNNHGYGLGNIEYIVEEYKGTMDIEDFGDKFSARIKLLIEKVECESS